ncbi:unnamed protein product [Eruca vesicaria subsp. sativa]|uniref:Uncharacterized protein n=1 Tax=Eruca vesicaria subsp. sativa TaxID=29727 RepID=A0ABC8JR04_ERUVS|nr:unnamed protein product [Eruca vesicaria subsp. sativa]
MEPHQGRQFLRRLQETPHRHSHFIEDVVLSGSWDGELFLWVLAAGVSTRRFVGHTKDVLSVAFSLKIGDCDIKICYIVVYVDMLFDYL